MDQPPTHESLKSQVSRLARFIMEEIPGEPSRSEGAVDTAIRIMQGLRPAAGSRERIAGLLSTFPPYDKQHPSACLPQADALLAVLPELLRDT